ncbi:MAG: IclR family transcriptional regulator [Hyphomicrobiales bacterium]|nr:MAG: IclR family transcriptional regulator [Hyphomicrobiales bacterium]
MSDTTTTDTRRTRGLDRAFEILDHLRQRRKPLKPNEIAKEINAPRSSVYELINLLLRHGIVEHVGSSGQIFLGRKLYFLGTAYAEQVDLMRDCHDFLERIAQETRETAQMCMLDGNKYTVAAMREGIRAFRISSNVGESVPIPWTASGRLLLQHLTDREIIDFIPPEDFTLPNGTPMDTDQYIQEVRQASSDGYFTFTSEVDTFTRCFAVPVYQADRSCIATLCLVAPKEDGIKNHTAYLACLVDAASDFSARLGFSG